MPVGDLPALIELLLRAPQVLIATHENPDADALGSALALAAGLRQRGQTVQVANADPVPQRLRFLPGWEQITASPAPSPLVVIVDAAEPSRTGALQSLILEAAQLAVIDHHAATESPATAGFSDDEAPAAAFLVYQVLEALGAEITPEIATCLYAGLGGDTGYFTYQNTDAPTLELAARLVSAGADPYRIHLQSAAQLSLPALHLRGRALASLAARAGGRLVYATLRHEDFAATEARSEDTEGIVDLLKEAERGEIFVLFKQGPEAIWRLSFRSQGADVGRVAREFGGGGHAVAAGCELVGEEYVVVEKALARLEILLEAGH
ncbi:MAG TPA: DHH family phosphoesterase [Armatimonadota bacterium]|jgi:phosphoesterase RecJ-like protein